MSEVGENVPDIMNHKEKQMLSQPPKCGIFYDSKITRQVNSSTGPFYQTLRYMKSWLILHLEI